MSTSEESKRLEEKLKQFEMKDDGGMYIFVTISVETISVVTISVVTISVITTSLLTISVIISLLLHNGCFLSK